MWRVWFFFDLCCVFVFLLVFFFILVILIYFILLSMERFNWFEIVVVLGGNVYIEMFMLVDFVVLV